MNYKDIYEELKDEIILSIPKHHFGKYKTVSFKLTNGSSILTAKVRSILNAVNGDTWNDLNASGVSSLLNKEVSLNGQIDSLFSVLANIELDLPTLSVDMPIGVIDKFPILPSGTYVVELAHEEPVFLAEDIAKILYYCSMGDVSSIYQMIGSISNKTRNRVQENRFATPITGDTRTMRIKPCRI